MTPVICQSQWLRNFPGIFCISNKGATSTVLGLFLKNGWSGYLKEGIIREAWGYYATLLLMCGCLWVLLVPAEGSEQWGTQWDGVGPALHLCGKLTDLCSSAFVLTKLVRFALHVTFPVRTSG